jgi:hypothetical protein
MGVYVDHRKVSLFVIANLDTYNLTVLDLVSKPLISEFTLFIQDDFYGQEIKLNTGV